MSNETKPTDDTISLDDFIFGSSKAAVTAAEDVAPVVEKGASKGPGTDLLDSLLAKEDPDFAQSMSKLKAAGEGSDAGVEIDSIDLDEVIKGQSGSLVRRALKRVKTFVWNASATIVDFVFQGEPPAVRTKRLAIGALNAGKWLAIALKDLVVKLFVGLKGLIVAFIRLPMTSKLLALLVVVFGALAVTAAKLTILGKIAPDLSENFIGSLADVADARFTYPADEPMDDFNDPMFHPEHIIQLDKIVVNLRAVEPDSNPMALFELYIEASTQEAAVELKDREVEARDVIGRTLEQMTYDELVTAAGKSRAKIMLRKNLNLLLTKGRIRRVFYKNAVLKP